MKKRPIRWIISLFMVLLLCACGAGPQPEEAQSITAAPLPESSVPQQTAVEEEDAEQSAGSFEEKVMVDNDQCKVTITGAGADDLWGYELKVALENKMEEVPLMFSVEDASVNGYMCDPFWAEEVAAGKKSNTSITWLQDSLDENSITDVEEIQFTLRVYNNDDWSADPYVEESFTIKP